MCLGGLTTRNRAVCIGAARSRQCFASSAKPRSAKPWRTTSSRTACCFWAVSSSARTASRRRGEAFRVAAPNDEIESGAAASTAEARTAHKQQSHRPPDAERVFAMLHNFDFRRRANFVRHGVNLADSRLGSAILCFCQFEPTFSIATALGSRVCQIGTAGRSMIFLWC